MLPARDEERFPGLIPIALAENASRQYLARIGGWRRERPCLNFSRGHYLAPAAAGTGSTADLGCRSFCFPPPVEFTHALVAAVVGETTPPPLRPFWSRPLRRVSLPNHGRLCCACVGVFSPGGVGTCHRDDLGAWFCEQAGRDDSLFRAPTLNKGDPATQPYSCFIETA
ncbi:hypothetical protein MRX96_003797 [Rhipicephalus microplus]